jgi:hypothetical protein
MYYAITERTDSDWPQDHPLRKHVRQVLPDRGPRPPGVYYLICTMAGDERMPTPEDDRDIHTKCRCGNAIVHRASADPELIKVCPDCWRAMNA